MARESLVTVIIPNWNGIPYLCTCLNSLKKLEIRNWKLEIIVVDNGSEDGSVEMIKKMINGQWLMGNKKDQSSVISHQSLAIRLIENKKNLGFAKAVNQGIKMAQGKYIALLNNDTEVDKNWLRNLVSEAQESSRKTMSFASKMVNFYQKDLLDDCGDGYTRYGRAYKRGLKQKDLGQFNKKEFIFGACAGAALYKRQFFEKIGLFDEDFFAYNEDVDLSFRSQLAGFRCLYVPQAIVYHVKGGFSDSYFAFCLGVKNTLNVILKNWPVNLFLVNLPKIIYAQARIFGASLKLGFFLAFPKGYFGFLTQLPLMFKKRRMIQKLRVETDKYLKSVIENRYPF